jgi:hypothetical protein
MTLWPASKSSRSAEILSNSSRFSDKSCCERDDDVTLGIAESNDMSRDPHEAIEADPVLRILWSYWKERRGDRRMPARDDIDPVDIPTILPHLQLVETVDGRFRFRLAGTAIVEAHGAELTGKYVDDFFPDERGRIAIHNFHIVQQSGRPLFVSNRYENSHGAQIIATRIVLPLWTPGPIPVGIILMGTTFDHVSRFAERHGMDAATLVTAIAGEFISD